MKLLIVISTRPEIIRLSKIIPKIKKIHNTTIIYTNQNYDEALSKIFFEEFGFKPDITLENKNKLSGIPFISYCMEELENKIEKYDAVLILGDTNGALATANVTKRKGTPLFHMEAFNRCYDMKNTPEEINRKQIDAISDFHLCYTEYAYRNGLLEGHHPNKLFITGNPIAEVMEKQVNTKEKEEDFYLVTIHRKENINNYIRLTNILNDLDNLGKPVKIISHPSLISKTHKESMKYNFKNIELIPLLNNEEFITMCKKATCVITDSGSVPEQQYLLRKPCVLLRLSTERPELFEYGGMVHITNSLQLKEAVQTAIITCKNKRFINKDYHTNVSNNVLNILMKYKEV